MIFIDEIKPLKKRKAELKKKKNRSEAMVTYYQNTATKMVWSHDKIAQ